MKKALVILLACVCLICLSSGCGGDESDYPALEKPVIYLYPSEETEVTVTLDFYGDLTTTYPAYNNGWTVIAQTDGTLTNLADGKSIPTCSGKAYLM